MNLHSKSKLTAHLAAARNTSFAAIDHHAEWSEIETRYVRSGVAQKLDPLTLGRLIKLTIQKEDRARAAA